MPTLPRAIERSLRRLLGSRYYAWFPAQHRNAVGGLWEAVGRLQFNYLVAQGLQPHHQLLDIGCGSLRGGVHFIRHLDPGHYVGVDHSQELLEAGRAEVRRQRLAHHRPLLACLDHFQFRSLARTFEYALAQSLFTHLPLEAIRHCLGEAEQVLRPGGRLYATFFEETRGGQCAEPLTHRCADGSDLVTYRDRDPYHYETAALERLCHGTTLRAQYVGDWGHPRDQHMLVFRKE